jgi:hypothetical protein
MGIVVLPSIEDYWTLSKLFGIDGVKEVMSRDRFKQIKRFLGIYDPDIVLSEN